MKPSHKAIKVALAKLVTFDVRIEPEDTPIDGNALASGDDAEDARHNQWVRDQLESGNEYAWCWAKVTARVTLGDATFEAVDSLGCCSYLGREDFEKHCLPDMRHEALACLAREVCATYDAISALILRGRS